MKYFQTWTKHRHNIHLDVDVVMSMVVYLVLMQCRLVGGYQYFKATCCHHLQLNMRQYVPPKLWPPTVSHDVTTQKTIMGNFTSERALNLKQKSDAILVSGKF